MDPKGEVSRSGEKSVAPKLEQESDREDVVSQGSGRHSGVASLSSGERREYEDNLSSDDLIKDLHSRAESLASQFYTGGGRNCIDQAIVLGREALELCPTGHLMRWSSLRWLAIHLRDRYDQFGDVVDIEQAITLSREALGLLPEEHPHRSYSLNSLAIYLSTWYNKHGMMDDLDEAIRLGHEALALRPLGHPNRSESLNNLAIDLKMRYNKLGSVNDLDEAIFLVQEALALCPPGHKDRSYPLNSLAMYFRTRYDKLGAMDDLDEAILLVQEALLLRPPGHPHRSYSVNSLATHLRTRYNKLGALDDLNEAIRMDQESLSLRPPGHPDRSYALNSLSNDLTTRYNNLGATEDLNGAISHIKEALLLHPPDRPSLLNNLAVGLSNRYYKLGDIDDLNEAIRLIQESLFLRPSDHPYRPHSLNNLAVYLRTRYNTLGAIDDLNEAIRLDEEALALRPSGNPYRSSSLNNLAVDLSTRFNKVGATDDLDEAIRLSREALLLRAPGHPDRSNALEKLAEHLYMQTRNSMQINDTEEIFSLYAQLAGISQMVSSADLSAARAWIRVAEECRHCTTTQAYETYLRLLVYHLATLPSLPQHIDLVRDRTSSLAMDAFSACIRDRLPTKAVELLEQGRGVFWSQLTRLRSPVDDVRASGAAGKALADKFINLTSLIRNALRSPGPDQHDRVYTLNFELQTVVNSIRGLPGFSRFLLPSLFPDLQQAAKGGPIIIVNASKYSCDALVVLLDRDPVHIPLQISRESVRDLAMELYRSIVRAKSDDVMRGCVVILREIWEEVVSPIFEFLQTFHPSQSRVWWCPTAEFCLLPLHAAGPYRKGQRNFAELYISSYTPTLTALIHARRCESSNHTAEKRRFVAIGQANAKGESELPFVATELANISQQLDGFTAFTRMEGPESSISGVTEALSKNEWVHFACHGLPDSKRPFESAFGLHDGHLTIQQIMQCELESAEFAYLSACHTMVGYEDSLDEMIHLASAMQFIGFRSVIGTMWAVNDEETTKITSVFYDNVIDESGRLDYTRAAFALHKTMKKLKVKDVSFDQRILYVHLGA